MMTAIALDDEPIALEIIKFHAFKVSFLELTSVFTNAFSAMEYLQEKPVDLLFLDIKMPDMTGMEFLKSLSSPPMVIFTTAYSEHAVESFELDAVDYLLKPFSFSRFLKACNKANELYQLRTGDSATCLFIRSGYQQIRINLSDILYVESAGNYMNFVLKNSRILSRMSMEEALNVLPEGKFVRIHRRLIIPVDKVEKIGRHQVWINKIFLPIGETYRENLQKKLAK